jgi:hypothetical protein
MKQQVNPAVAGIIIAIIVIVVAVVIWRGTGGGASKAPGEVGNPSPFAPGGAAAGQGGMPSGRPSGGSPFAPGGAAGGQRGR